MDWKDDCAPKWDEFPLVALRVVRGRRDGVPGEACKVEHILIVFVCPLKEQPGVPPLVALVKVQQWVRKPKVLVHS